MMHLYCLTYWETRSDAALKQTKHFVNIINILPEKIGPHQTK